MELKIKKIPLKQLLLIILILVVPISKGLNIFSYDNIYSLVLEFGNRIVLNLGTIFSLLVIIFNIFKKKKVLESYIIKPLTIFYFICLINVLITFFDNNYKYSIIGLFYITVYFALYYIISSRFNIIELAQVLDLAFKFTVVFQCFVGMIYVFFNISIPLITVETVSIRNGLPRMYGTFQTSGELSLYLVICLSWFLIQFILLKNNKMFKYIILSIIGIYLTGARTTFFIAVGIITIVIFIKYRKSIIINFLFIILLLICGFLFLNSDFYYEFFIRNSIFEMAKMRFLHWIVGFEIFKENYIFGIGLNNIASYINENYYELFSKALNLINIKSNGIFNESFMKTAPIHNSFILILNELGFIGFISYIYIYIYNIKNSFKVIKLCSVYKVDFNQKIYYQNIFICIAFIIFIVYGLQGWALMKQPAWIIFVILCAYLDCLRNQLISDSKNNINYKSTNIIY